MSSHLHPAAVLIHLLKGLPLTRSLDPYPPHWRVLINSLATVPAHPRLREQALQRLLTFAPDSVLDEFADNIENPDSLLKYIPLNSKQRQIIAAVSQIGPAMAAEISRHLYQDPSNIHKRLHALVSLGQLERFDFAGRIYYRLTESDTYKN